MKKLIGILVLVIIGLIFFQFGRSIYMPILYKMKGKETVESRILKIEKGAWNRLEQSMKVAGFSEDYPKEIMLVAFKEERILQMYGFKDEVVKLIKEYPFTAFSGEFGPKIKEGDKQIPEGIYKVEYLNANSSYYLSIKVNFPNSFDQLKTSFEDVRDMGGDIFIHGKAATIGCIPIGDEAIEEVFLVTQKAFNKEVKVIISPRDFRVNPLYPKIEGIDWENELYDLISEELRILPSN